MGVRPCLSVSIGGQRCWGCSHLSVRVYFLALASEMAWKEQLPSRKGLPPVWILAAEDQSSLKGPTHQEGGWWQGVQDEAGASYTRK